MQEDKGNTGQRNEGEGNRTVARKYNQVQQRFAKSGRVDEKAREAERDIEIETIRLELEHAEPIGRRHYPGEDPYGKR
jgi:hypothetical protein